MLRSRWIPCTWFVCLTAVGLAGGCGQKKSSGEEVVPLEGKVEKVDAQPDGTGKLTVSYRDRQDREMVGAGEVTKDTRIMINGAAAKLADIKLGDRIKGNVKIIKSGKERRLVAINVEVDRPQVPKPTSP